MLATLIVSVPFILPFTVSIRHRSIWRLTVLPNWTVYRERVVVQERMASKEPFSSRFVLPGDTTRPE